MSFCVCGRVALPIALLAMMLAPSYLSAQENGDKPDFPSLESVTEGYTKISPPNGESSFYTLWYREKDQQLLAELPKDFEKQRHFIALTVSSGSIFAGLQTDDYFVRWRRYNDRLALIEDNLNIRSTGDPESKDSVARLFTDELLLDVPILTMVPRGGPVIDLDELLVKNASTFFGSTARTSKPYLARFTKTKAFPDNVEVAVEFPCSDGTLRSFHYSFSNLKKNPDFKKREADTRVGFFTTSFDDFGRYDDDDVRTRYINRWHLEKRDPDLRLSPPKEPIIFYLEHTTPVRYRRWVREGALYWNKAFEQVGIINAIEVYEQDKSTGAHMDKDPEDVRYNFIRWLNNDISTAIGPSRVDPRTGEILDADIVLTDGWIRTFDNKFENEMPKVAMSGMSPETLAWLADHPNWDPRIRLAPPSQREFLRRQILAEHVKPFAGQEFSETRTRMLGDEVFDGLVGRTSQVNGNCLAADGRAFDVATMRMMIDLARAQEDDDDEEDKEGDEDDEDEEDEEQLLDGMPESFIGPLLADLVCHEVGHTLGLRHNFKASSIYTLAEMNSEELKGQRPFAGSVMDYLPVNFNFESGEVQGDWAMIGIGPYDMWAIQYGYEFDEKKLPKILARVAEPELAYATDEDTGGPDPLAQRYDFSKNPLDYAENQMRLAQHHRQKLLEEYVDEGDSWSKARRGYEMTLRMQISSASMMSRWIGGAFVNRDKKGDPNGRQPIEVVPVDQQRRALQFVLDNSFDDEVYGLTPNLLNHMSVDKWSGDGGGFFGRNNEPTYPVHDRVMGIQATTLTNLMTPSRLRRVYDNEFRIPAGEDALTLPELMKEITGAVWTELEDFTVTESSDRKPLISSLRRNLQTEHLERLFDLANEQNSSTAAMKPIANLAAMTLKELQGKIDEALGQSDEIDSYTRAHLMDASDRIGRWLDSKVVVQAASSAPIIIRGQSEDQ
ncbi:MAG: zinc-dependent metalloprotease [Pirellulaceae bacterium]